MSDKNFKVKNGLDANGAVTITQPSTSTVPLTILANTLATGSNLLEVKRPDGTVRLSIGNDGAFSAQNLTAYNVRFYSAQTGSSGLIIRGLPSQTADLQQWRDINETVLASVSASGSISAVDLTLSGNLTVNGTTTNLNSTNLVVEDKNIIIADVTTPTDTTADGAGITIKGATDKTLNWVQSTASFTSSEPFIVNTNSTTRSNLIVKAIASQTSNLTEWHNSVGGVVAKIDSNAIFNSLNSGSGVDSYSSIIIGGRWIRNEQRANLTRFGVNTGEWHLASNPDNSAIAITDSQVGVFATSTTLPLLTVKGMASQTANLQEWQDSAGTVLARIDNTGNAVFLDKTVYANQLYVGNGNYLNATMHNVSGGAADIRLLLRAHPSQTANIQEWQNSSGTVLSRITSSGQLGVPNVYSVNGSGAYITMNSASGAVVINTNAAGNIGIIIGGAASQTANLQEWRNSAGTVLASISPAGKLTSAVDASINGMTIGLGGGNVSSNVAFGQGALASNVSGQNNTAIGYNALNSSTSTFNVAIGGSALAALTTGGTNVALGVLAMRHATTADSAVAIGYSAAGVTTTGGYFVAIGAGALGANVTGGTDTVAIGYAALNQATATSLTTAVGSGAGYALTTGTQNTYLGRVADGVTTGSNNMMLGYSATSSSATVSNEITLGNSSITRFRIPGIGLNITSNSTINTASAATVGLIVKGAASQTANLQQWQDSAGNLVAWTGFDGRTYLSYSMIGTWNLDAQQTIYSNSASRIGQVIRGAASQTANLQEWQNSSGTVLTRIGSDGAIYRGAATIDSYGAIYTTETMAIGANAGQRFATGGLTIINRENASAVILGIKGLASQSGDLTQWRNSSDVVIANVAADGAGTFKALTLTSGNGTFTSPGWSGFGTFGPSGGTSGVTLGISPYIATNTALVVKGFASQSANLQEWQDSTGGLLAVINNSGQIATYGRLTVGSSVISTDARMVLLNTGTTTSVLQIIRGIASQTGDLTQWQNSSGTVLASVSSTGKLTITNTSAATSLIEVNGAGGGNFTVSAYGGISTNAGLQSIGSTSYFGGYGGASNLVLNVTGASGQTGDLQRWTNFAGTILAKVDSLGNFTATSKSFDIEHPTKENMRLRYGSLEGPENGVYIRGTVESNVIELPEYWTELVHKDSITASLTPVGSAQNIYVEKIENNKIYIGGDLQKAFFTVYGERKDIDKITVEY